MIGKIFLIIFSFFLGLTLSSLAWINPDQNPPFGGGILQTDSQGLKIITTTRIMSGNLLINTGNLGIGVLPTEKLTISGNIALNQGSNSFIGTIDNYALGLRTNNIDRIFISNDGKVGIGTNTPQAKLDVTGRIYQSGIGDNIMLGYEAGLNDSLAESFNIFLGYKSGKFNTTGKENIFIGAGAGNYIFDEITPNSTSTASIYLGARTKSKFSGARNEIVIGHNAIGEGTDSVVLGNDDIIKTILKGNVGIGTTTPYTGLHIAKNATWGTSLWLDATPITNGRRWAIQSSGGDHLAGQGKLVFVQDNATYRMVIDSNGNVGIGTTNPTSKLTVNGDISATSINTAPSGTWCGLCGDASNNVKTCLGYNVCTGCPPGWTRVLWSNYLWGSTTGNDYICVKD